MVNIAARHHQVEIEEKIHLTEDNAFAIYSLPGSTNYTLIKGAISSEMESKGAFLVQRFEKEERTPHFISPDLVASNAPFSIDIESVCLEKSTSKKEYLAYTQKTINAIRDGQYEKIVMSRKLVVPRMSTSEDVHAIDDIYHELRESNPDAFVFLYNIPDEGCWCGATPEVLLKRTEDVFQSMALAGTQADTGIQLDQVTWDAKEIHEQHVIEQFVEDVFDNRNIHVYKEGPHTVKAGQVLHLSSVYTIKKVRDPLDLAERLHPGPAICGIPKDRALDWIKQNENHQRRHYCGYIGPWEIEGNAALFINLRSMNVNKDQFVLYLGGGITSGSEAESEWHETSLKAKTLLSIIQPSHIHG